MHSGLYNFLKDEIKVGEAEKKEILDEAHKIYTDHLKKLAAEGKKVSDQELSKISSSSYDTAMEKLLKRDSTVKANYERETSAIGSASTPGGFYISKKTGKRKKSGVSVSSVKDPTSTMPDYVKIGNEERAEFGDDAVQAHIVHPNLLKRALRSRSRKVNVYGAEGVISKQEIDQIEGSGKVIGKTLDDGVRSKAGLDEHSNSRKGHKTAKEYTGGMKDGLNEGKKDLNAAAINTAEEVTNTTEKAMTKGQARMAKLKSFTSGPMGRMGGSMALMAGSMALQKLPEGMAKDFASSATSMASMGMMFGPWGAAAGAAIGLATTGIGKLMEAEKAHQALFKSTFTASATIAEMFGGKIADASLKVTGFNGNIGSSNTALQQLTPQMQALVDTIDKLPKDDPFKIIVEGLKKLSANLPSTIEQMKLFVATQVALGAIPADKAQDLVKVLAASSGQISNFAAIWSAVAPSITNQGQAMTTMLTELYKAAEKRTFWDALGAAATAFSKGDLPNDFNTLNESGQQLANTMLNLYSTAGNKSYNFEQLSGMINSLKDSGLNGAKGMWALELAIQNTGSKEAIKRYNLLEGYIKKGGQAGKIATGDFIKMNLALQLGFDPTKVKGKTPIQALIDQINSPDFKAAVDKANEMLLSSQIVVDSGLPKLSKADLALTNANKMYESQIKLLEKRKKIIDDEISRQQKVTAELKKQNDFKMSQADIENQIKEAQMRGNYLQAANLKQQMTNKSVEFAAENVTTGKQAESDKLQAQIDKYKEKIQANIDALDKNTNAIKDKTAKPNTVIPEPTKADEIITKYKSDKAKAAAKAAFPSISDILKGKTGKNKAMGGLISGPGTGTSDSIPASIGFANGGMLNVSNGEYIQRASAVSKYGVNFMDSINTGAFNNVAGQGNVVYNVTTNVNVDNADAKMIADMATKQTISQLKVLTSKNNKSNMVVK
jgi:hypothetical protein